MTWWVAGAAVVGAVGGSLISSDAARSATNTQADSTAAGIAEQRRQFDLQRSDSAPYRTTGVNALNQLAGDINTPVTASDVMSDPGYQFGLDQGMQALDRKIAAMGGRVSGAALKEASRYGTGYASTGYNAAYQRKQDRLNRLAALAGIGQTSTAGSAAAGAQSANAISGMLTSQGDASAAGRLATANTWANTGNQIAALYGRSANAPAMSNAGGGAAGTVPGGYDMGGQSFNNPSAWDTSYSDARLKTNLRRVGTTARGHAWYVWDWKTGGRGEGVIAQEVAHIPGAVHADADGVLMVDYSRV